MRRSSLLVAGTACFALGCGDAGAGPGSNSDGTRLAAQFERLADSVDAGGYSPAADALRHAAEIVRLTGHATPVTLAIDGTARSFLAVAEQIDYPNLVCSWPSDSGWIEPGDTVEVPLPPPEPLECTVVGTYSMRALIAWEPEHMEEVVRIVAHIGNNSVETGVPDVMTGLPTGAADPGPPTTPPDSGSGSGGEPGGFPGFMGEYLVRDVGSWWAVEGSQSNALEEIAGVCTDDRATFDWSEFDCEAARLRFEFAMGVEPLRYYPPTGVTDPPGGPEGSHTLSMGSSAVDGVRLTWAAWTPPPEPGPGPDPLPVDSSATGHP